MPRYADALIREMRARPAEGYTVATVYLGGGTPSLLGESELSRLFAALRELDDPSIHQVYARCPEGGGVAYAVQNRLKKAAAFCRIDAEVEV